METTKEFFKDLGVMALIFVIFFLAMDAIGCGDGGTPVYNDQGECVANCGDDVLVVDGANPDDLNGRDTNQPDGEEDDGFVQPDDGRDADAVQPTDAIRDCGSGPDAHCSDAVDVTETDLGSYECPYDLENGLPPEPYLTFCLPEKAASASAYLDEFGNCWCVGGYHDGENCNEGTGVNCGEVRLSDFPPCVCWDTCYLAWFTEKMEEPETWYCRNDMPEVEVEEYYFDEIHFLPSYKNLGSKCGIQADTNYGNPFYIFSHEDQEKRGVLHIEKNEDTMSNPFPLHYLVIQYGVKVVEVHRENDGKIFAMCYTADYWN